MSKVQTIFAIILLEIIAITAIIRIIPNRIFYTRPYNSNYYADIYSHSQYVEGESAQRSIGDDGLYPFAGYYYITGGDPSQVNFENPPIGKYLIGSSILVFGNENIIYLFYALAILGVTYALSKHVLKNTLYALLVVTILSVSSFFQIQFIPSNTNQLSVALLDLPLTVFFLLGMYTFITAKGTFKQYAISSILLGFAFSTKFFPSLILLLPVLFWDLRKDKKKLKKWFISLIAIPIIYIASYTMYFVHHPSLIEFIKYQRWIISWRLGNPFVVGNIWRTIFTGRYINWWDGGVVVDQEWTIGFAIITILGIFGGIRALVQKRNKRTVIAGVCGVYLLYLTVNTVGVARYTLIIFPLLSILAIDLITGVSGIIKKWQKSMLKQ